MKDRSASPVDFSKTLKNLLPTPFEADGENLLLRDECTISALSHCGQDNSLFGHRQSLSLSLTGQYSWGHAATSSVYKGNVPQGHRLCHKRE